MKTTLGLTFLVLLLFIAETRRLSADRPDTDDPSGVVDVAMVDEKDLDESSGLAESNLRTGYFWSHNDSGGKARLYAFDKRGHDTGWVKLKKAENDDWEDVTSFQDEGVSRLLVADVGDNTSKRKKVTLYLFDEPDPDEKTELKKYQEISLKYPDGPRDCEAIAVEMTTRRIILVSKTGLPIAGVYSIPLPARENDGSIKVTAKRLASLPFPMVTAMDIDPVNGDVWLVSYFQAFRFSKRHADDSLVDQLRSIPTAIVLPRWKQIEAVAVDHASDIWVTSEGSPTKLGRLPQNASADSTDNTD